MLFRSGSLLASAFQTAPSQWLGTHAVKEAVEVDVDGISSGAVEENVLAVAITESECIGVSLAPPASRGGNAPEDESDHGDDGRGARVGEPRSEPGGRLGERLEEPLVEDGRVLHEHLGLEALACLGRVVADGVERFLQLGALCRRYRSGKYEAERGTGRDAPSRRCSSRRRAC